VNVGRQFSISPGPESGVFPSHRRVVLFLNWNRMGGVMRTARSGMMLRAWPISVVLFLRTAPGTLIIALLLSTGPFSLLFLLVLF
jgi:hypothetical protein